MKDMQKTTGLPDGVTLERGFHPDAPAVKCWDIDAYLAFKDTPKCAALVKQYLNPRKI